MSSLENKRQSLSRFVQGRGPGREASGSGMDFCDAKHAELLLKVPILSHLRPRSPYPVQRPKCTCRESSPGHKHGRLVCCRYTTGALVKSRSSSYTSSAIVNMTCRVELRENVRACGCGVTFNADRRLKLPHIFAKNHRPHHSCTLASVLVQQYASGYGSGCFADSKSI